jgi:hypothetical protein
VLRCLALRRIPGKLHKAPDATRYAQFAQAKGATRQLLLFDQPGLVWPQCGRVIALRQ